jgi:CubicO group peptidase (beta-lactamase class C family)
MNTPSSLRRVTAALVLSIALTASAFAQGLPLATPESVGMSGPRLHRLSAAMKRAVDEEKLAGVVTLVARKGKVVHFENFGELDRETHAPMPKNAIFRIASMSKAITTTAAMMLVEEGKLLLDDPVSKFIPAFKKATVMAPSPTTSGPEVASVPARREITIRDLMTHTSGLSYGSGALEAQYKAANVYMWYFADKDEPIATTIERLATLPFASQPGERYVYGFSTDVLGVVVERASGMSLDEFFRTRIFAPLKMVDSSFYLPPDKASRFATVYSAAPGGLRRAPEEGMGQGDYVTGPRKSFSGGAGVLSTTADYARFLQMLLNGGELDGVRLLGPKSVQLMTSNHVGNLYQDGRFGFGLGFEIVEHVGRGGRYGSVGEYGWGGAYYTKFWVDPAEKLVAVFMTQLLPSGGSLLQDQFRVLVNQAIVASDVKH